MRFKIMEAVKKLVAKQTPPEPRATAAFSAQLAGLDAPGLKKAEIIQPVVVASAPAPVVAPIVEQTARICSCLWTTIT